MNSSLVLNFKKKIFTIGQISLLSFKSIKCLFSRPFYLNKTIEQIIALGVGSISLSVVIGFVMGSVMTLQFGYGLAKFGGTLYVPAIVSLSLFREMAPIFTSLLVAGRVASGIAAEIGSMNVTQQVDALRALGTDPIRVLVVPRLLALIIALPLLTTLTDIIGLVGSALICVTEFEMNTGLYLNKVMSSIKYRDFFSGLLKTQFFAFIIVVVSCYKGLNTSDGTRGVGVSTTWSVVNCSIWLMITNFILAKIFLTLWSN